MPSSIDTRNEHAGKMQRHEVTKTDYIGSGIQKQFTSMRTHWGNETQIRRS
jgi:hypothetical protein